MYDLIRPEKPLRYQEGLQLQQRAYRAVAEGTEGVLIVLEHQPVLTVGTGGGAENLLVSDEFLASRGIDIQSTDRGGNVTFHGPGQIVAYPIFDLNRVGKDLHRFITALEQTVIDVLDQYGVHGSRKPEYRGVWIDDRKISAVGVHVKRWITTHGLSFNICVDKDHFKMINPCGIREFGICSLDDFRPDASVEKVKDNLIMSFQNIFDIEFKR